MHFELAFQPRNQNAVLVVIAVLVAARKNRYNAVIVLHIVVVVGVKTRIAQLKKLSDAVISSRNGHNLNPWLQPTNFKPFGDDSRRHRWHSARHFISLLNIVLIILVKIAYLNFRSLTSLIGNILELGRRETSKDEKLIILVGPSRFESHTLRIMGFHPKSQCSFTELTSDIVCKPLFETKRMGNIFVRRGIPTLNAHLLKLRVASTTITAIFYHQEYREIAQQSQCSFLFTNSSYPKNKASN